MMQVKELNHNPENPRTISDEKLRMLKKSLEEFGDLSCVVYNVNTARLVGGHQRQRVLPPDAQITINERFQPPSPTGTVALGTILMEGEKFYYREVSWDEIKEKAANIAANNGAGEWDYPQLTEWLKDLESANYDLEKTMFDSEELDRFLGGWNSDLEGVENVDENLDGILSTIKVKCPQEIKDEVLNYLKAKFLEVSFEGISIE